MEIVCCFYGIGNFFTNDSGMRMLGWIQFFCFKVGNCLIYPNVKGIAVGILGPFTGFPQVLESTGKPWDLLIFMKNPGKVLEFYTIFI